MEENIKRGDTVVDIGANIGLFTLLYARAVGERGRVFAFEPEPVNVGILRRNIAANGYNNIEVVPAAVGDRPGKVKLFLSDFNAGDHRVYDPEERTRDWEKNGAVYDKLVGDRRKAIDVPTVSLDEFLKSYEKPIAFIKMDAQGAEGGILKGMTEILKKNRNVRMVTEFWPAGLKMFGVEAQEFLTLLQGLGFSFCEIGNDARERRQNKDFLLHKYTVENNRSVDLLVSRTLL
ncbi:MAG: FkbM family methyltransferase [Patescibacteria group bacterium]